MHKNDINTLLIVPCYNERYRLSTVEFLSLLAREGLFILFVDDGSQDGTSAFIQDELISKAKDRFFLLTLKKNGGKAEAVRQGMLVASQLPCFSTIQWVGFWDADLATPFQEAPYFISYAQNFYLYPEVQSIWGSRVYRLGSSIKRKLSRHYLGRVFATVAKVLLNVESYDSQCGAKLFRKEIIKEIFAQPFISRWMFDLEIYLRMDSRKIIEYPLQSWHDKEGSKLSVIKESWRTLRDFYRIYKHYCLK